MGINPYNPANWYWSVQDSSPGTQVWSSASGSFVALADATYVDWLALDNTPTTIDTFANLMTVIGDAAVASSAFGVDQQIGSGSPGSGVAFVLTNPLLPWHTLLGADGPNTVTLPAMNLTTSIALGRMFYIEGSVAGTLAVKSFGGAAINDAAGNPIILKPYEVVGLVLEDNSTAAGVFSTFIVSNRRGRARLFADKTFYVRTDGNDSNTGLFDSAGGAFLTWQGAFNAVQAAYDWNGFVVTLALGGSGSGRNFTNAAGGILTISPWQGGGSLAIVGDTTTPTNSVLTSTDFDCILMGPDAGSLIDNVTIDGFEIRTVAGGSGINNQSAGHIFIGSNMVFGACALSHVAVTWRTASMRCSFYTISGNAEQHVYCDAGLLELSSGIYNVTGTRAFTQFARCRNHGALISYATWNVTGSVTGSRFQVNENALIRSTNEFPGNIVGEVISGIYSGAVLIGRAVGGITNRIINGDFKISQRGTSFTDASGANNDDTYNLDRWILLSDGNDVVDVSQDTADVPTAGMFAAKLLVVTVNKKFGLLQLIEQKNCVDLIGETITLSFKAKVNNTTRLDKIKAAIVSWTSTADVVTSDIVSAWNGDGTNPTLVANWTYENTPTDLGVTTNWAAYTVSALIDTVNTRNIGVFIWSDNVTDTDANDTLAITDVQLEHGTVATRFARRTVSEEMILCLRYFQRIGGGWGGRWASATNVDLSATFPVVPRTTMAPVLNTTSPIVAESGVANRTASPGDLIGGSDNYGLGGRVRVGGFTGATAGSHGTMIGNYLDVNCEL